MLGSTERGFVIYADFQDRYDGHVRVVQSSLATEDCVWIFVDASDGAAGAAHLTVEQATVLRDALTEWIGQVS